MDDFLDSLAGDLAPIRRRSPHLEVLALAGLCGLELALFLAAGLARPNLLAAFGLPMFWWKLISLGGLAVLGFGTALRSFAPEVSPRRGLLLMAMIVAVVLGAGWLFDAVMHEGGDLVALLNWRDGLHCVGFVVGLSVPPVALLAVLMRRAAATHGPESALAIGAGAAAWAAFVFVFACPHDDPLYVAVWYGFGCGLTVLLVRLLLPRLTRW